MRTELSLITYVVTCKYKTNSAGLKTLHKQFFTDINFSKARQMAFEYVEAAKEFIPENELTTNQKRYRNPSGVYLKNKEFFETGIQIFMRINEDFNQSGWSDKNEMMYLIAAFHPLNDDLRQRIKAGRIAEQKYYKFLNQTTFEKDQFMIDSEIFDQEKNEIEKFKLKSFREVDFIPFSMDKTVENIFGSICAFANSGGGTIIFGQDEKFNSYHSDSKINKLCNEVWGRILSEFPEIEDYLIMFKRNLIDCRFLEIQIIPTPFDCLFKGEYYIRTIHGNVMDLEKSM